ncbi:MAG TPA: M1 family peptidase [Saprospiraceae bacterium]|nr:M1 family peptidase [Saprospiraceae bacterium]
MQSPFLTIFFLLAVSFFAQAQPDRWQQHVDYQMNIDFDVKNHQFNGTQKLVYTNNSPDKLKKVFFHLYLNAFQKDSQMALRAQSMPDTDPRVAGKFRKLTPKDEGFTQVKKLTMDGQPTQYHIEGTVLEVSLPKPILPHSSATFEMEFLSQVPIQIRRNGRNNAEGIDYSMSQWYPKMAEYDLDGWHTDPYVAREFYGVWGDFDVKITIDKNYVVAAGGYIQNPEEVGHGYGEKGLKLHLPQGDKYTYHFKAPNVHDFVWAADRDYVHTKFQRKDGEVLHFFYQKGPQTKSWDKLPAIMDKAIDYANEHFGQYQYKTYSFIQGGDGGMEYPLATLITGNRPLNSLVGVAVHEQMHSWYQMMLASNELLYPWMDEGFTTYASTKIMNYLAGKGLLGTMKAQDDPFLAHYARYFQIHESNLEEPLSTHADHYMTNTAYWTGAYTKGEITLRQLEYVIGEENVAQGLLKYFDAWHGKHPNANDFFRIMEKQSGLQLDWYQEYWIRTIHGIDYGIKDVSKKSRKKTKVTLEKIGVMPMPLDVVVTFKNGDQKLFYIPLREMRGEKTGDVMNTMEVEVLPDWGIYGKEYQFTIEAKYKKIKSIEIDPSHRMADTNQKNNLLMVKKK